MFYVFYSDNNSFRIYAAKIRGSDFHLTLPILILAFASIVSGYVTKQLFIGPGSNFLGSAIHTDHVKLHVVNCEFIPAYIKLLPTLLGLSVFALALNAYNRGLFIFDYTDVPPIGG
jgi:hypothetical protein